jgi:hypothetical protein
MDAQKFQIDSFAWKYGRMPIPKVPDGFAWKYRPGGWMHKRSRFAWKCGRCHAQKFQIRLEIVQ